MELFYKNRWTNATMEADKKKAVIKVEGYIGIPRSWYYDEARQQDVVATKEEMSLEIKNLKNLKVTDIDVHINSYGGDVNHGIAMYEALLQSGATVNVKIFGFTASIATVIAMAAPFERRTASINSMGLIHETRGGQSGTAAKIMAYANWLIKVNGQIADIYEKSTTMKKEDVVELMSRVNGEGEWLTATEMKEKGLISDTFEPMEAAASFEDEINACGFLPKVPVQVVATPDNQSIVTLIENTVTRSINAIKDLLPKNTLTPKDMSKQNIALAAMCAVLAVSEIAITDDGAFLNTDQLKAINDALAKRNGELTTVNATLVAAQAERQSVLDALDGLGKPVKDASTVDAKITAVREIIASKPGANPTVHQGGEGGAPNDGIDWDVINNLPHNREADKILL